MKNLAIKFIAAITPDCDEIARLSSESLDRPLTLRERIGIKLHHSICFLCVRYRDQLHSIHNSLAQGCESYGQSNQSVCMTDATRDKLKAMLAAEGRDAEENAGGQAT